MELNSILSFNSSMPLEKINQNYQSFLTPNASFRINPAPSLFCLQEYGGDRSIEEYRKFNYTNNRYIMSNINSKIITF